MPTYNAYTKTNDFPLPEDYWIDPATGKKLTFFELNRSPVKDFIKRKADDLFQSAFREWVIKYNIPQSIIDEWNRLAQQAFNEAKVKSFWQRIADRVTTTVSNFLSQAEQVLKNAGENVALAPLLPFKLAMVNALKRKGEDVTMTTKLGKVANLFNQKIINRSSTTNYLNHNEEGEGLTTDQILQLIDKIIPFFTLIMQKIGAGTATSEERLINSDAESEADKTTGGGAPTTTGVNSPEGGDFFKKNKFLIIGVVAVVLFLAFRKK